MNIQDITTTTLVNGTTNIASAVTLGAAGNLTLNGSLVTSTVAYLYGTANTTNQGQKISITDTADNTAVTATITGTGPGGDAQTEAIVLANNGTVTTTTYFRTVSNIAVSAALTGNLNIGWLSANGAASREFYHNRKQSPFNVSLSIGLSSGASLTYTVQYTTDPCLGVSGFSSGAAWRSTDGLTAGTASAVSNYAYPVTASRVIFTAYTSGTARYIAQQGF